MISARPLAAGLALLALGPASPGAAVLPDAPFQALVDAPTYPSMRLGGKASSRLDAAPAKLDSPAGSVPGFRFAVREACDSPIDAQAIFALSQPVAAGDVLWAHFFLRTTRSEAESGEGKVELVFENAASYRKSLQFPAMAANEWKEFSVPFTSLEAYAPGSASFLIRLGYRRETVEIAGLTVRDYGRGVRAGDLPATRADTRYDGMEPDAPWRAAAQARIEKIRKAPLTVQVVDPAGNAVAGAQVEVCQTRQAYGFGSAVSAAWLAGDPGPDDVRRRDAILKEFNMVTFENDLKWTRWTGERRLPLEAARWCADHGVALRGHNMVWPSWRHLPPALREEQGRPEALRAAVLDHIRDVGSAVGGLAPVWDVVNEPYDNHDLMDLLGPSSMADWFNAAHRAAPGARLFLNDYGIVTGNGMDRAHQANFEKNLQSLVDQKAAIQGLGIQGHFGQEFTAPAVIDAILDRFGRFGLPIEMTEFSTQAQDPQRVADYLRDVMTVFFANPATDAFVLWTFQGSSEYTHMLYDDSWQPTPAGKVWDDLVLHQWRTRENVRTGPQGEAEVSGFLGSYEIRVRNGDASARAAVDLPLGGATARVVLPAAPAAPTTPTG